MVNNQVKIHFTRADEYINWKKNLQSIEKIASYIKKLNLSAYLLPNNKPLSDILHILMNDSYLFYSRPLKKGERASYSFFHPASGKYLNFEDTLHNQGINDNDVIVIKLHIWNQYVIIIPHITPLRFIDELLQIFNINNPNLITVSVGDENSPLAKILETEKDENPLYAILLYTEEDKNIAEYVRRYYNELNKLSGKTRVFVFEKEPSGKEACQYWSKRLLSLDEYIGWNALGLTKTKPYEKAQIYELCEMFGIPKDKVPCILFFNNLDLNDQKTIILEFPKDEELKDFFRHVFTICDKAVNVPPEKRIRFLISQLRKYKAKRVISGFAKRIIKDVIKEVVEGRIKNS
jgi:hypothetical protein